METKYQKKLNWFKNPTLEKNTWEVFYDMTDRKSLSLTGPHSTHLYFNCIRLGGVQNCFQLYDFKWIVAALKCTSTLLLDIHVLRRASFLQTPKKFYLFP